MYHPRCFIFINESSRTLEYKRQNQCRHQPTPSSNSIACVQKVNFIHSGCLCTHYSGHDFNKGCEIPSRRAQGQTQSHAAVETKRIKKYSLAKWKIAAECVSVYWRAPIALFGTGGPVAFRTRNFCCARRPWWRRRQTKNTHPQYAMHKREAVMRLPVALNPFKVCVCGSRRRRPLVQLMKINISTQWAALTQYRQVKNPTPHAFSNFHPKIITYREKYWVFLRTTSWNWLLAMASPKSRLRRLHARCCRLPTSHVPNWEPIPRNQPAQRVSWLLQFVGERACTCNARRLPLGAYWLKGFACDRDDAVASYSLVAKLRISEDLCGATSLCCVVWHCLCD